MIEQLPEALLMVGSSPDLTARELIEAIDAQINNHPRSQQVRIGPSEIGQACKRRLAYKLLGHEEAQRDPAWLPTIGTAVHSWLEEALAADNARWVALSGSARWATETRVSVGEVDGVEVTGSADVYDRVTGTVIDWKIVGPTTLKKYKANGPGSQYRTQAHLYGRGFTRADLPVERVMIAFLPRNAPLHEAHFWHESYDEQVALNALEMATSVATLTRLLGHGAIAHLDTTDDYCGTCPYFRAGSTDLTKGCAGHPRAAAQPFSDLLAG